MVSVMRRIIDYCAVLVARRPSRFLAAAALGMSLLPGPAGASSVVAALFGESDCSGYFGSGFGSCNIFITSDGTTIQLSPVIAKYNTDSPAKDDKPAEPASWEVNSAIYPSVTSAALMTVAADLDEFAITGFAGSAGTFTLTPGAGDPLTKYWATKAGNGFLLSWFVENAAGSLCTGSAADQLNYNLTCLSAALVIAANTAINWVTPGNKSLSHITFYDTDPPTEVPPPAVPIPAALPLFGSALVGMGLVSWRKRRKAA